MYFPLVCSIDRVGVYSAIASVDPVNMRLKRHSTVTRAIAVMRITFFGSNPVLVDRSI